LGGPQAAFCDLEEHNALTAHQERRRLEAEGTITNEEEEPTARSPQDPRQSPAARRHGAGHRTGHATWKNGAWVSGDGSDPTQIKTILGA
jgi:hypothetical protein